MSHGQGSMPGHAGTRGIALGRGAGHSARGDAGTWSCRAADEAGSVRGSWASPWAGSVAGDRRSPAGRCGAVTVWAVDEESKVILGLAGSWGRDHAGAGGSGQGGLGAGRGLPCRVPQARPGRCWGWRMATSGFMGCSAAGTGLWPEGPGGPWGVRRWSRAGGGDMAGAGGCGQKMRTGAAVITWQPRCRGWWVRWDGKGLPVPCHPILGRARGGWGHPMVGTGAGEPQLSPRTRPLGRDVLDWGLGQFWVCGAVPSGHALWGSDSGCRAVPREGGSPHRRCPEDVPAGSAWHPPPRQGTVPGAPLPHPGPLSHLGGTVLPVPACPPPPGAPTLGVWELPRPGEVIGGGRGRAGTAPPQAEHCGLVWGPVVVVGSWQHSSSRAGGHSSRPTAGGAAHYRGRAVH